MTLEIKKYPDPILRKKCAPVKEITSEIKELGLNMVETMATKEGVGLAGPQVGELRRIIAISFEGEPQVFINPQILSESKETEIIEEGCLSFPDLYLKIKRAKEVEVKADDMDGKTIRIRAKGLLARTFQHEIDHLEGILFIDYLRGWRRLWELLKFYIKRRK